MGEPPVVGGEPAEGEPSSYPVSIPPTWEAMIAEGEAP